MYIIELYSCLPEEGLSVKELKAILSQYREDEIKNILPAVHILENMGILWVYGKREGDRFHLYARFKDRISKEWAKDVVRYVKTGKQKG